jgi:TonB family protein
VRLLINESGEVYEVALLQSSTFQRLDRAAIEIGRRYRFKPFLVNGAPVKISTNLLIKFNLKEDEQTSKQKSQQRVNISELTVVFAPLIEAYFFPEYLKSHEGTNVSLELSIDEKGNVISGPCDWVWVRPNERRGCVGCHEDHEIVPDNRRPLSVIKDPVSVPVHINKVVEKKISLE